MKVGKILLYSAAAVAVAALGFAMFKKWQTRIVGAPAAPYGPTSGAGAGVQYS